MKRPLSTLLLAAALTLLVALATHAQVPPGSGGGTPDDVPLDGGASLLLAAGVGLGLRRLRQRRAGS